jgi:hypothetical protein
MVHTKHLYYIIYYIYNYTEICGPIRGFNQFFAVSHPWLRTTRPMGTATVAWLGRRRAGALREGRRRRLRRALRGHGQRGRPGRHLGAALGGARGARAALGDPGEGSWPWPWGGLGIAKYQ